MNGKVLPILEADKAYLVEEVAAAMGLRPRDVLAWLDSLGVRYSGPRPALRMFAGRDLLNALGKAKAA